ncbi:hypothetical protein PHYBOEH_003491 [Phytophthora boehmeriae]|uniref:Uncharacterized protein n=1 Tax=Phytophthora boehmeriae TaxID=109152 RepID=A0A8T1X7T2_9STRA|nr:hypothetical protein PHYBOEH_003491 [Phytophthora boehmeriae]
MHPRQPVRVVSASVRAHRSKRVHTSANAITSSSSTQLDDPSLFGSDTVANYEPRHEPSWRRTGRSSMAADVRIPSFLIPCSASQLMDARYKSHKLSVATPSDVHTAGAAA